jgi:hypothetical protein
VIVDERIDGRNTDSDPDDQPCGKCHLQWSHAQRRRKESIHFSRMDETISCTTEDNGIGINKSENLKNYTGHPTPC